MLNTNEDLATGAPRRWAELRRAATVAEEAGFATIAIPDHLLWRLPVGPRGFHEHVTVLGAISAVTSRIRIASSVICTSFRAPGLTAKVAATAQEISGGRYALGLGAGGPRSEYQAFGYPADHLGGRFAEQVEIISTLLREGSCSFNGRWHRLVDADLRTVPGSEPPTIVIAAKGPRTIDLAVRFADEWNWYTFEDPTPELVSSHLERVDAACRRLGRDPADLVRSFDLLAAVDPPAEKVAELTEAGMVGITGSLEEVAGRIAELGALGISEVRLYPYTGIDPHGIEALAPLVEAVA